MRKLDDPLVRHPEPIKRRDATGHLDPKYERELLAESRENQSNDGSADAFIHRPRTSEPLGEELGEAFIESATTGEDAEVDRANQVVPEENGGPFVQSNGSEEFAAGTDASNITEATREPFPKTSKADS